MMTADGVALLPADPPVIVGDVNPGENAPQKSGDQDSGEDVKNAEAEISMVEPNASTTQAPTFASDPIIGLTEDDNILQWEIDLSSEDGNENDVPTLSKIPYINRLFNNSGVDRDTRSLMIMVTPRIIIQEEEESFF